MKRILLSVSCGAALLFQVSAEENPAATNVPSSQLKLDGGGDIRLRQEAWNRIPKMGGPCTMYNYFRIRERVWGEVKYTDDYRLYVRFVNETRHYIAHRDKERNLVWPDQIVLDNLYLDINNRFKDSVDFRIGRQDLDIGSWRISGDGTPGDTSRTAYTDSLLATWRANPKNTIKFFGIFQQPYDYLSMGETKGIPAEWDGERQLTMKESKAYDAYESGAGFNWRTEEIDKKFPVNIYSIWKRESDYKLGTATKPGRNIFTSGILLNPKFTDELSAESEFAWQGGQTDDDRDICAWMAYNAGTWKPSVKSAVRPYLTLGVYALSGDKNPNDGTDTNWNALWGRTPQISDLMVLYYTYSYNAFGYWSNMIYPFIGTGTDIGKSVKITIHTGPMFAETQDVDFTQNGGEGQYRGYLVYTQLEWMLVKGAFNGRGDLSTRLRGEVFWVSDYTEPHDDAPAYFLQWQVIAAY